MLQDIFGGVEFVSGLVLLIGAVWAVFSRLLVTPCVLARPAQTTKEE
jgi:hypothetical protein